MYASSLASLLNKSFYIEFEEVSLRVNKILHGTDTFSRISMIFTQLIC